MANSSSFCLEYSAEVSSTSFPGSLFFPPKATNDSIAFGGKKRDPGNEVEDSSGTNRQTYRRPPRRRGCARSRQRVHYASHS